MSSFDKYSGDGTTTREVTNNKSDDFPISIKRKKRKKHKKEKRRDKNNYYCDTPGECDNLIKPFAYDYKVKKEKNCENVKNMQNSNRSNSNVNHQNLDFLLDKSCNFKRKNKKIRKKYENFNIKEIVSSVKKHNDFKTENTNLENTDFIFNNAINENYKKKKHKDKHISKNIQCPPKNTNDFISNIAHKSDNHQKAFLKDAKKKHKDKKNKEKLPLAKFSTDIVKNSNFKPVLTTEKQKGKNNINKKCKSVSFSDEVELNEFHGEATHEVFNLGNGDSNNFEPIGRCIKEEQIDFNLNNGLDTAIQKKTHKIKHSGTNETTYGEETQLNPKKNKTISDKNYTAIIKNSDDNMHITAERIQNCLWINEQKLIAKEKELFRDNSNSIKNKKWREILEPALTESPCGNTSVNLVDNRLFETSKNVNDKILSSSKRSKKFFLPGSDSSKISDETSQLILFEQNVESDTSNIKKHRKSKKRDKVVKNMENSNKEMLQPNDRSDVSLTVISDHSFSSDNDSAKRKKRKRLSSDLESSKNLCQIDQDHNLQLDILHTKKRHKSKKNKVYEASNEALCNYEDNSSYLDLPLNKERFKSKLKNRKTMENSNKERLQHSGESNVSLTIISDKLNSPKEDSSKRKKRKHLLSDEQSPLNMDSQINQDHNSQLDILHTKKCHKSKKHKVCVASNKVSKYEKVNSPLLDPTLNNQLQLSKEQCTNKLKDKKYMKIFENEGLEPNEKSDDLSPVILVELGSPSKDSSKRKKRKHLSDLESSVNMDSPSKDSSKRKKRKHLSDLESSVNMDSHINQDHNQQLDVLHTKKCHKSKKHKVYKAPSEVLYKYKENTSHLDLPLNKEKFKNKLKDRKNMKNSKRERLQPSEESGVSLNVISNELNSPKKGSSEGKKRKHLLSNLESPKIIDQEHSCKLDVSHSKKHRKRKKHKTYEAPNEVVYENTKTDSLQLDQIDQEQNLQLDVSCSKKHRKSKKNKICGSSNGVCLNKETDSTKLDSSLNNRLDTSLESEGHSSNSSLKEIGNNNPLTELNLDYDEDPTDFEIPTLHKYETVCSLNEDKKENMRLEGVTILNSRYTKAEDEIIIKNYKEFADKYKISDPFVLLGIGTYSKNKNVVRFIRAKHFYARLGKGLDNRTLISIYKRARILLHPYKKDDRLDYGQINSIKFMQKTIGKKWQQMANTITEDSDKCLQTFRWHEKDVSKGSWLEDEKLQLIEAIKKVNKSDDVSANSVKKISWDEIAAYVPSRNSSQCRWFWERHLASSTKLRWDQSNSIKLIKILQEKWKVDDSSLIDWNTVYESFKNEIATPTLLRKQWLSMKYKIPDYKNMVYSEILEHLCAKFNIAYKKSI